MQYVEGITFHDLAHSGDHEAIAEAAFSAGETLAYMASNRPDIWVSTSSTMARIARNG
jgi:hypothetical protein